MKNWRDFFKTDVSDQYVKSVMSAADAELVALQSVNKSRSLFSRLAFLSGLASFLGVGLFLFKQQTDAPESPDLEFLSQEDVAEMFDDPILLDDLDMFEELELIESLNEETGELES